MKLEVVIASVLMLLSFLSSCSENTDFSYISRNNKSREGIIEEAIGRINDNTASLRELVSAYKTKLVVKEVVENNYNGDCIGYTMFFEGGSQITLYNCEYETEFKIPIIGVKKGKDGIWYWTINGGWLLNTNDERVCVEERDGNNCIIPIFQYKEGFWWVSCDKGAIWFHLGPLFHNGERLVRESTILSVCQDDHYVTVLLSNGEIIQLSKINPLDFLYEGVHDIENDGVRAFHGADYNGNDYSYSCLSLMLSVLPRPYCFLPRGKVITTDVDANAVCRYVEYADNMMFLNSRRIKLDNCSSTYVLNNLEGNKEYYYRVYKDNNPYLLLNNGYFRTKGTIRQLKIDASQEKHERYLENVRDVGGWNVGEDRIIRYGVLIRGPKLNSFNEREEQILVSNLGIKELIDLGVSVELDLRSVEEVNNCQTSVLGNGVSYYNIPIDQWFYHLNIFHPVKSRACTFASLIRLILSFIRDNKTVYIHCSGGCDRTGVLCAVIEGLCGVSENDINIDYELSIRDRSREYYSKEKGDAFNGDFKFAMEYIKGLIKFNNHLYVYYRGKYYDAEADVYNFSPISIDDASLTNELSKNNGGTLQEKFRLLMELGGMTIVEMEELEELLCTRLQTTSDIYPLKARRPLHFSDVHIRNLTDLTLSAS